MRRTYLVAVAYHVSRVCEVKVRAANAHRACQRAIQMADEDGDGWRSTDAVSDSFVESIEVADETPSIPNQFTKLGVLAPELFVLWQGLQLVAAIAEDQGTDAAATLEKVRSAARAALWQAWRLDEPRGPASPFKEPGRG